MLPEIKKSVIIISLLLSVSGCSVNKAAEPARTQAAPPQVTAQTAGLQPAADTGSNGFRLLNEKVIPSSSNTCIDDMQLLKQTQPQEYALLSSKYSEVINEFRFLRRNENIMDNDTKSYLSNILSMKLDTLCSRIKYKAFMSVKQKTQQLYDI